MDETSNAQTTFTPLKVSNNIPGSLGLSQAKEQDFTINVQMPKKFNCIGASTGNICTIRCRNNAVAGPFGGCFAVQQTDGAGRSQDTSASGVETTQTADGIAAQIDQNQKDLPAAIAANQAAGAAGLNEGALAISALITATVNPNAVATPPANAGNGNQGQNGKGNGRNGGGRGGNGQQGANGNAGAGAGQQGAGNGAAGQQGAGNGGGRGRGGRFGRRSMRSKFLNIL